MVTRALLFDPRRKGCPVTLLVNILGRHILGIVVVAENFVESLGRRGVVQLLKQRTLKKN